ncbi:hypothetical protein, partial [Nocardia harenae]|uniref:hypothetical protein n=1 Tax=Nocardia harenae TaxID=358707 RepID=UPI001C3F9B10
MKTHNHTPERAQSKETRESENPAKQNTSKKTLADKKSRPPHGGVKTGHQKTFGTDIHRHTIEFSKNTRT